MRPEAQDAMKAACEGIDEILDAMPQGLPIPIVTEKVCEVILTQWCSERPSKVELGLAGLLAAALARLKELERL